MARKFYNLQVPMRSISLNLLLLIWTYLWTYKINYRQNLSLTFYWIVLPFYRVILFYPIYVFTNSNAIHKYRITIAINANFKPIFQPISCSQYDHLLAIVIAFHLLKWWFFCPICKRVCIGVYQHASASKWIEEDLVEEKGNGKDEEEEAEGWSTMIR